MPIIAARRYCHGKAEPHELAVDGTPREALPPGCFDWVGLSDPDGVLMDLVMRQFGLHPLAVEDAMCDGHPAKVEPYGDQLFLIARTAALCDEVIEYGQTAMFLGKDFLVTVRQGNPRAHLELRSHLEANAERLAEGPDFVLHAVLDFIADGYDPVIDALDDAVHALEEEAIDAFPHPDTIRRIFRLRRQLRRFERTAGPMEEVARRLATAELPAVDATARPWFRDVHDHVRRSLALASGLKEMLASVVDTAGLLEQHRQGVITRQLAAWAAILAVPTAVAGIYGMNFEFMPELHWRFGYAAVLALIGAICGSLYWQFKRIGWL